MLKRNYAVAVLSLMVVTLAVAIPAQSKPSSEVERAAEAAKVLN